MQNNTQIDLSDDGLQMVTNQINFKFDRCNKSAKNNCKSDLEIDEFLKDLKIITYSLSEMIDLSIYNQNPTFKS